jgi:hypothetical protein
MVLAPIEDGRQVELSELLSSLNSRPGVVDPHNAILPFAEFGRLHFARFVILDDQTREDIKQHGIEPPWLEASLVFLGDCDGGGDDFLEFLVQRAGKGLRQIFSHCAGFGSTDDLLQWMKDHSQRPAAMYVNWLGRTVEQIREESDLHNALVKHLASHSADFAGQEPRDVWEKLVAFVRGEIEAKRLKLSPYAPTPIGWRIRNLMHLMGVPLILLFLAPLLILYLPVFSYQLRRRETADPEITPRPDREHVRRLAELEDHYVTNQFSALGAVKPGLFRRWTVSFFVWILDYGARHIYNRGHLTRVNTIHFARWVFLDNKKRLFFASNYDGSLESYMDDFINKVGWGLNLVFSNGVGYPKTNWLIFQGAKDEQKFKNYIRRHELATEVWYNAHPGLTAFELDRNSRIREGLTKSFMRDDEIREWLKLI